MDLVTELQNRLCRWYVSGLCDSCGEARENFIAGNGSAPRFQVIQPRLSAPFEEGEDFRWLEYDDEDTV